MACLSSLPFAIEGSSDGSASARPRVLVAMRQGKALESVSCRDWRNGTVLGGGRGARLVRRIGEFQRKMRTRAVGGDESENSSEDVLQETIEKGKKVLAVQKELLQQISERRKLVSSMKNSITNDDGSDSSQGSENTSSYEIRSVSSSSASSTGSNDGSSVADKVHTDESSSGPKIPKSPTSRSRAERKKKSVRPERVGVNVGSNEGKVVSESSAKIAENQAYSGKEGEKISSNETSSLDVDSFVKSERVTVVAPPPSSMYELQESVAEELPKDASESTTDDVKPPPLAGANVMNIIFVAAECSPFSKTGGLGDVAGSLPKALARRGHRVMVVVPKYGNYPETEHIGVVKRYRVASQDHEVNYFHAYIDGVDFVFVESPVFRGLENNIYGGNRLDILKRMVLFCKAAVEVPWYVPCGGVCYGDGNLVFIANDWHTALLPVYLKAYYREKGLMTFTRSVLVIHNIAHQGRGPVDDFRYLDLPGHWMEKFKLYDPLGGDHCNIFAAGLKAADRIVTVSHAYAWELKTPEGGWGLHSIIGESDWKLRGIVNGIDTKEWSPQSDAHLQSDGYTNYSLYTLRTGKRQCKSALQKELGLPQRSDVPLIGFIGRLDDQKGVDLIAQAVPWMMDQDVQLVMLGTGRPDLEQMLRRFEGEYRDKARGWVGFSVKTAHRITAGADILLMPSRFEPCGLNQLYAMNYGTVPVVHAVGGLRDTVHPFDPFSETGYGWTFDRAESGKLIEALGNCLLTYRQYKESWEGLQRRGMLRDLSWDNAAEIYEEVLVAAKYQW